MLLFEMEHIDYLKLI